MYVKVSVVQYGLKTVYTLSFEPRIAVNLILLRI